MSIDIEKLKEVSKPSSEELEKEANKKKKRKEWHRKYYQSHKKYFLEQSRKYYLLNKEKRHRKYLENHPTTKRNVLWSETGDQIIISAWKEGKNRSEIQKLLLEKLGIERTICAVDARKLYLQRKGLIENKHIERAKNILSKNLTIWICGLISTHGASYFKKKKNKLYYRCVLVWSIEKDWIEQIEEKLKENSMLYTIYYEKGKKSYIICFRNFEMLRLYKSMKIHKIESYMKTRKLSNLEKYLEGMNLISFSE